MFELWIDKYNGGKLKCNTYFQNNFPPMWGNTPNNAQKEQWKRLQFKSSLHFIEHI